MCSHGDRKRRPSDMAVKRRTAASTRPAQMPLTWQESSVCICALIVICPLGGIYTYIYRHTNPCRHKAGFKQRKQKKFNPPSHAHRLLDLPLPSDHLRHQVTFWIPSGSTPNTSHVYFAQKQKKNIIWTWRGLLQCTHTYSLCEWRLLVAHIRGRHPHWFDRQLIV